MIFKSSTMNMNIKDAVSYLTFKNFDGFNFLTHAFSTRIGGVSENCYKSMNLSFFQGDKDEFVEKNYNILFSVLGLNINKIAMTNQIHDNFIKIIKEKDIRSGNLKSHIYDETDGLITDIPGVALVTYHADCPAVFIVDPVKKVIGVAHAGWRGTVKKIAENLVKSFVNNYNSSPENLVCAVGPSISGECFEVSEDILVNFENLNLINKSYLIKSQNIGKVNIDLPEVNRQILIKNGVRDNNIIKSDVCTKCYCDLLFSHRAMGKNRGTNVAVMALKNV
ncbi:MAG: peptidoglycan editing factor PgeF [Acutalibacteraceae bacterium]